MIRLIMMCQKPDRKGGLAVSKPSLTVGLLILVARRPFHLKMRSGFTGAHEPCTLKQIHSTAEPDDLQTQWLAFAFGLVLQFADHESPDAVVTMFRQQRHVDATDLVFAAFHNQPAGRFPRQQDYLVICSLVFALVEMLLRFVLHSEKLADAFFVPPESTQIVTAAALVDFEKQLFVAGCNRSRRDRLCAVGISHMVGILIEQLLFWIWKTASYPVANRSQKCDNAHAFPNNLNEIRRGYL